MAVSSTRTFPYSGMDSGLFKALIGDRQSVIIAALSPHESA